ncbi:MAG TPA: hypothetical protein VFZ09_28730 [Archangium sp.]|uniref:hypothetical protein n=1 Tax=Archangium sp. TaxID=1872627 RepID=UPI002E31A37D|nr:hypothetical protein [Archangium sp.]HEX5750251.1 hypothetical protein [Archangium sp.]
MRLLVLLAVLQAGCLSETEEAVLGIECGPRDLTPECCLKKNPGQWERCTGSSELARVAEAAAGTVGRAPSLAVKTAAAGMAGVMVTAVHIGSAERRGVALATDLLKKVEEEIVRCVRQADREVNAYHFGGKSPTREQCQEVKVGERTTWAAYLGLFKHETAWPCLREALDKLLKGKYLLHPRFYVDPRTGEWVHMPEDMMSQIVAREGWSGLRGTIEPDIVLLDANGVVIHAYDLKFPCPESNGTYWGRYVDGPWRYWSQGELYEKALQVPLRLVSPQEGVVPDME